VKFRGVSLIQVNLGSVMVCQHTLAWATAQQSTTLSGDADMTAKRLAFMPLATYPQAVEDGAVKAAINFAASIGHALHVKAFAVDLPRVSSGLGDYLINIAGVIQAAEERSRAEGERLQRLVQEASASGLEAHCAIRKVPLSAVFSAAASEARYCDLTLIPWSAETGSVQDLAEAIVFGSGRPAILVPTAARFSPITHIAIAWDGSRVAARALGDVLPLLEEGGRISVLTVEGEKQLDGSELAAVLASSLAKRGYKATPVSVALGKRNMAEALQEMAISEGSQLLAMGGFGHSRIRDFILGGATKGVLSRPQLPVLLSH
jgi:nucleotide-binding universal stress UspA family protein